MGFFAKIKAFFSRAFRRNRNDRRWPNEEYKEVTNPDNNITLDPNDPWRT